MKKTIFTAAVILLLFSGSSYAQLKIGYVDTDAILKDLPDAQDVRSQLDQLISEWQGELNRMQNELKSKYDDYEKRKLIMSDQTRAEVEEELTKLEKDIIAYREKKFGNSGELFTKQEELMKPIHNKLFNVIQDVAKQESLDFVLDRSGGVLILYAKAEYDITALVIEKMK